MNLKLFITVFAAIVSAALVLILGGQIISKAKKSADVQRKGAIALTEVRMETIQLALMTFKDRTGDYPHSADYPNVGSSSNSLFGILSQTGYFEHWDITEEGIIDAYGNAYGYTYPGSEQRSGKSRYDLWSTGASGDTGNEAYWIKACLKKTVGETGFR